MYRSHNQAPEPDLFRALHDIDHDALFNENAFFDDAYWPLAPKSRTSSIVTVLAGLLVVACVVLCVVVLMLRRAATVQERIYTDRVAAAERASHAAASWSKADAHRVASPHLDPLAVVPVPDDDAAHHHRPMSASAIDAYTDLPGAAKKLLSIDHITGSPEREQQRIEVLNALSSDPDDMSDTSRILGVPDDDELPAAADARHSAALKAGAVDAGVTPPPKSTAGSDGSDGVADAVPKSTSSASPKPITVEPTPKPSTVEPTPKSIAVEPLPKPSNVEPLPKPVNLEPLPKAVNLETLPKAASLDGADGSSPPKPASQVGDGTAPSPQNNSTLPPSPPEPETSKRSDAGGVVVVGRPSSVSGLAARELRIARLAEKAVIASQLQMSAPDDVTNPLLMAALRPQSGVKSRDDEVSNRVRPRQRGSKAANRMIRSAPASDAALIFATQQQQQPAALQQTTDLVPPPNVEVPAAAQPPALPPFEFFDTLNVSDSGALELGPVEHDQETTLAVQRDTVRADPPEDEYIDIEALVQDVLNELPLPEPPTTPQTPSEVTVSA